MNGIEDVSKTEYHEEGAEKSDEGCVICSLIGKNDEANNATDHTTSYPEEAVSHIVFETNETDDDGGDTTNERVSGKKSDMEFVPFIAS